MPHLRFKAVEDSLRRSAVSVETPTQKISELFGVNVFGRDKMQHYLSSEAYESVINAIDEGRRIDRKVAAQVASGMKAWAMELNATHYT
ncbi:MAG: glutamine synthetase type III, partial [Bacteroidetes bacterium HGW-Bacteroidetes-15]